MNSPGEGHSPFQEVDQILATQGIDAALDFGAARLRTERKYHQWFDARLMQIRRELGLPVASSPPIDELPEPLRTQLENRYLELCRELGAEFVKSGSLREAWMYLRPAGEKELMARGLEQTPVTDENLELIVELALHEEVAPAYGYALVLSHYGTCNAITMFESLAPRISSSQRQKLAALLLEHVHHELKNSVRVDMERRDKAPPAPDRTIAELIADRPELFQEMNYHLDSSHLAATVRVARLIDDVAVLPLAADLAAYGQQLDPTYQYPSEAPFEELYGASGLFFAAQLSDRVDEALEYFGHRARERAESDGLNYCAEVYIALLARIGRYETAIDSYAELVANRPHSGLTPGLLELARAGGQYDQVARLFMAADDLGNYLAVRALEAAARSR